MLKTKVAPLNENGATWATTPQRVWASFLMCRPSLFRAFAVLAVLCHPRCNADKHNVRSVPHRSIPTRTKLRFPVPRIC